MKYFRKLKGEKVYLSPLSTDDYEKCAEWVNNSAISDRIGTTSNVYSIEAEKRFLEKMTSEGAYCFAIVNAENDEYLGNISLEEISSAHRTATLGVFIGEGENHNKGFGSEAINLALNYAFNCLNLNNIMLTVFSFNEPALHVYQKIGFKEFGRRHNAYFVNGKYHDVIYMEVLAADFLQD